MPEDLFAPDQGLNPQQKTVLRVTVDEVMALDTELDAVKKEEKRLREAKAAKTQAAVKLLIDAGTKSVRFDDGLMVTHRRLQYPSVAKEFWPKFKLWLQRNKYWGLATIHHKTLTSLLKERLERKQPVPEYVKIFEEDSLSISGRAGVGVGKEEADASPTV